jgi:spermidine synthase
VRRGRGGVALRVDGTFASWHAPGSDAKGTVWEAIAAPLLLLPARRRRSILVLGLGGGSAARLARVLAPRARIVGVERDPEVLRAARRWFDLSELGLEVVQGDARAYLARSRGRFDAVLEDVFVGRGRAVHKPAWVLASGLPLAAGRLRRGGILVSNALDEAPAVARILAGRFPRVLAIGVEGYDNRVLVGAPRPARALALRRALAGDPRLAPALPAFRVRTLQSR